MDFAIGTTDTMEESSALTTNLPAKRKFETDPEEEINEESGGGAEMEESGGEEEEAEESGEESGESGEESVDSEEEMKRWWKEPEWDVDSFDGMEYNTEEEEKENELSDQEAEIKWRRYKRQAIGSRGFYVQPNLRPELCISGSSRPFLKPVMGKTLEFNAGFGKTYREFFADMCHLCLQKYNQEKGYNVEFVEVVRGIYTTGGWSKSYITFRAKEQPDGPLVEYQAKVWSKFGEFENYPILCRPAPPAKNFYYNH